MNNMRKKRTVLIIDDVSSHLLLLQNIMEEEGYEAVVCNNPIKVRSLMEENEFNVVLLDIMMPGMDGFQVLDSIQQNKSISKIPVIVISAKTDAKSIKSAMKKGAFDYITKPINIQDVKNKVSSAFLNN